MKFFLVFLGNFRAAMADHLVPVCQRWFVHDAALPEFYATASKRRNSEITAWPMPVTSKSRASILLNTPKSHRTGQADYAPAV